MLKMKDKILKELEEGRNETIELLRDLIRIPSYSLEERKIAEFLARRLQEYGCREVEIDEFDNVLCTIGGSREGPTLLYNGHTDVVALGDLSLWPADPLKAPIMDGKVIGWGACDMKGSIAAMMAAIRVIKSTDMRLKGNLILTLVSREEKGLHAGTEYVMKNRGLKADFALVGEPSNLEICLGSRGAIIVTLSVKGKSSHAGNPSRGINAIVKMAKLIEKVESMKLPVHDFFGPTTHAITDIRCEPGVLNMVPNKCSIWLSRRISPGDSCEKTKAEFLKVIEKLKKEDPEFDALVETDKFSPAAYLPPEESVLQRVLDSSASVLGKRPPVSHWFFGTDASYIGNEAQIPWFGFGPGDPSLAHSVNEHVKVDDLVAASKVYAMFILDLLG